MNVATEKKPVARISAEQIQRRLEKFDWEAHWDRVIEKVSRDADAFDLARTLSRAQVSSVVFI